mmetsp:Transcript_28514/g.72160  ORF Transcript_28514/g.72160 Transcript_28514/m.72160 type:complete len:504 (+) Transcript_28514:1353-2864(+)
MRDARDGRGLLLIRGVAAHLLAQRVAQVGIGELPDSELAAAEAADEELVVGGVELKVGHLPGCNQVCVRLQLVLRGPDQDGARRGLARGLEALGKGLVLAVRARQHVRGVRYPLDPLHTLAFGVLDIVERSVLLDVRVGLGDVASILLAEVGKLLLEDVDGLVRLQRLLDADANRSEELRELVNLVIPGLRSLRKEVVWRVLGRLVHRSEPSGLARGRLELLHCLNADLELLALQREVGVLLRPTVLHVLARVAELAGLAELGALARDHHLHRRPPVLHGKVGDLQVRVFSRLRHPLLALPGQVTHHDGLLNITSSILAALAALTLWLFRNLLIEGVDDLLPQLLNPRLFAVVCLLRDAHDELVSVALLRVKHQEQLGTRELLKVLLDGVPVGREAHPLDLVQEVLLLELDIGLELHAGEGDLIVLLLLVDEAQRQVVFPVEEEALAAGLARRRWDLAEAYQDVVLRERWRSLVLILPGEALRGFVFRHLGHAVRREHFGLHV